MKYELVVSEILSTSEFCLSCVTGINNACTSKC